MSDSVAPSRQSWTIRPDTDRRVAIAGFGLAMAIGLVFAFVGLDTHSLWFDELFTARLLEPWPGTTLFGRIVTDVHPPLYLLGLGAFTELFGMDESLLRLPSALAACGAIGVFVLGTRSSFSLPGGLFGAALATGSLFWFNQAQNARSYALCLLIVAGILALALPRLRGERRHLPALLLLMLAGTFTHFYVLYVSLAVLILLSLFERRDRVVLAAAAIGLVLAAGLYVKLVIEPHTRVSLGDNWYSNDPAWYLAVLRSCLLYTLGTPGLVALLLTAVALLHGRRTAGGGLTPDRTILFLVGTPVLVLLGAIAGSMLFAPNFWDRNFLVVSPFFWALGARLYDAASDKAAPAIRLGLTAALAVLVLSTAGDLAAARRPGAEARDLHEPYRQSAEWIRSLPACRGETLPVITTDSPTWYKPGYAELIYGGAYDYYLEGFAPTQLVFSRDLARGVLPAGLTQDLQRRLGGGCPVLAWSAHNMSPETIAWIQARLLALLGADAGQIAIRAFEDGTPGYVLTVKR